MSDKIDVSPRKPSTKKKVSKVIDSSKPKEKVSE
jgi:hypothetical protein